MQPCHARSCTWSRIQNPSCLRQAASHLALQYGPCLQQAHAQGPAADAVGNQMLLAGLKDGLRLQTSLAMVSAWVQLGMRPNIVSLRASILR